MQVYECARTLFHQFFFQSIHNLSLHKQQHNIIYHKMQLLCTIAVYCYFLNTYVFYRLYSRHSIYSIYFFKFFDFVLHITKLKKDLEKNNNFNLFWVFLYFCTAFTLHYCHKFLMQLDEKVQIYCLIILFSTCIHFCTVMA